MNPLLLKLLTAIPITTSKMATGIKFMASSPILLGMQSIFAMLLTIVAPTIYSIAVLFFAHLADIVSAIRLNHRLHKCDCDKYEKPRVSSEGFKSMIKDFGFELFIIALGILIEIGLEDHGVIKLTPNELPYTIFLIYFMIGGQVISILENESSHGDNKWAKMLNGIFKSKASRYLKNTLGLSDDSIESTYIDESIKQTFDKPKRKKKSTKKAV